MGRRRKKRGLFGFVQYLLALVLYGVLNLLPRRIALWSGTAAGALFYGIDRRHRRLAQEQLQLAFPDWSAARVRRVARRCYAHLGISAAEFARLGRADRETVLSRVAIEGIEHLERARAQGRGVIFLTAHLGNWELMAAVCGMLGYRLFPVARPLDNPWLNRLIDRIRGRHGGMVVSKKAESAPTDLLNALRRGDLVGILLDQNARGIFVDFFSRPASTSTGLALIARRSGAPVVPAFIVREASDRHRILIQPPVDMARSRDLGADVTVNTARCTAVIERMVRAYPEQWLWLHRRWKTQPAAVTGNGERNSVLHATQSLS